MQRRAGGIANAAGAVEIVGALDFALLRNRFVNNQQAGDFDSGGAIYIESTSRGLIVNNLFEGNEANGGNAGGAIFLEAGVATEETITFRNNTFVDNRNTSGGTSIHCQGAADAAVLESVIFWNASSPHIGGCENMTVAYSDAQGGALPGTGNISADPEFAETTDYTLGAGSPCIDAGVPGAGTEDPDGTRNDMGWTGGPRSAF